MSAPLNAATIDDRLRLRAGFTDADRRWLVERLAPLGTHLGRWKPDEIDLEISVKERDGKEQSVTLQVGVPGLPRLVTTETDRDLDRAVNQARREIVRQLEDEKHRREPQHNRFLREKTT